MKIAIGNDHTATELKEIIKEFAGNKGYEVIDLGISPTENCDYPVYEERVGKVVASGKADLRIIICDTDVGTSLVANKVKGVRTCMCSEPYTAKLFRMHNNSDALAFDARMVESELVKMITKTWLNAKFEDGRHEYGVNIVAEIENRQNHKGRAGI